MDPLKPYRIIVFWTDEDQVWICKVEEFPSCSVFGDTPEQAIEEMRILIPALEDVSKKRP